MELGLATLGRFLVLNYTPTPFANLNDPTFVSAALRLYLTPGYGNPLCFINYWGLRQRNFGLGQPTLRLPSPWGEGFPPAGVGRLARRPHPRPDHYVVVHVVPHTPYDPDNPDDIRPR